MASPSQRQWDKSVWGKGENHSLADLRNRVVAVGAWILGYILGAYVLAMRALQGLGGAEDPEIWMRLLALVIGVMAMAILNFIPFLGWMVNFALVLLGIGGMTTVIFERLIKNASPATDGDK